MRRTRRAPLLAAVDDSAVGGPVLETARRVSRFLDADVVAVSVREDGTGATVRRITAATEIPPCVRRGDVIEEIEMAAHELGAIALAVGARALPIGAIPAGHVATRLAQDLTLPVFIVPPDVVDRPIRRRDL